MTYRFEATPEERAAAALLRKSGYVVNEPRCPMCHGWGTVQHVETWGGGMTTTSSISATRCPNGCPTPAMYFGSNAGQSRTVVADGNVGMRRGE